MRTNSPRINALERELKNEKAKTVALTHNFNRAVNALKQIKGARTLGQQSLAASVAKGALEAIEIAEKRAKLEATRA